ncbi:MAG: segregation and condensation protein A [Opitutaceae bacterium]
MVAEADPRIRLPVFEGPLDLLLFLIRKSEIDVYDIPIASVLRQYLSVLRTMTELQLEIAGEFFVMAATLMEIKSRMLLPKDQQAVALEEEEAEAIDPRWDLVHQLIQYKRFKEAAGELGLMADLQQKAIARDTLAGWAAGAEDRPLANSDKIAIWGVFNTVLRRLAEQIVVGEINDEHVTIVDQMEFILERIGHEKEFGFSTLFAGKISLRTLIVTFLAVLELARLKKLCVRQSAAFDEIHCAAWEEKQLESPAL